MTLVVFMLMTDTEWDASGCLDHLDNQRCSLPNQKRCRHLCHNDVFSCASARRSRAVVGGGDHRTSRPHLDPEHASSCHSRTVAGRFAARTTQSSTAGRCDGVPRRLTSVASTSSASCRTPAIGAESDPERFVDAVMFRLRPKRRDPTIKACHDPGSGRWARRITRRNTRFS
jgi:hypothetical protein